MVNYLAVLVAAIAAIVISFIWYNPKVLGTVYLKLSGAKEEKSGMAVKGLMGLVVNIVEAYVLAMILGYAAVTTITGSIGIAALVWVGFIGTLTLGAVIWDKQPFALWVFKNAHALLNMIVMAIILTAWV